ncbi:activity-dependent neuroprotector homeobox a [Tachysurus fulvidraco]|uniref:activity-dependent neuroprotector homeobox a n=1 Tax=Tachysurus fulvidraco TaxID=1234273 RepID=UPI000F4FB7F7|nr:activity-dependent neuroprotector homeobox a [Tachysurus fulvidraco]
MFQLPVNNLTRLRKARKRVKRLLSDIGLDYCKEHIEDYKAFGPDEFYMKHFYLDVCMWDPSWTKSQDYRTKQFCCSDCPFASKYFSAYKNHFRNVHRDDFENRILLNCSYCMYSGNKRTLETHVRLFHMPYNVVRQGIASPLGTMVGGKDSPRMDKPMLTDRKELAVYYCKKCNYRDRLYNVVRRHIYREHFQHVTTPYVVRNAEKQESSEEATISSYGIHCKSCLFVCRSYEALVQHVIEFHEHIGYQVTAMIGHTNVMVARSQGSVIQRGAPVTSRIPSHMVQPVNCFNMPKVMRVPVGNHFKQGVTSPGQPLCITLPDKALLSSTASQSYTGKHQGSLMLTSHGNVSASMKSLPLSSLHPATSTLTSLQAKKGSANALNTSQTQKWKICTICNELFPESTFALHVEKVHQLDRVQAIAKYIMKIHTFTSKCLYCNRYLPSDTLLNHMLIHGLTCPQCDSTFYEVDKIVMHKRQMHPNEPADLTIDSPLTFDLTLQQGSPKNVQLIVTTYNVKEAPKSLSTTVHPPNNTGSGSTLIVEKGPKRSSESLMRNASKNVVPQNQEIGKTLCPLCFAILKGPVSDALSQHLQDRHQVLQTLHPVEKKHTYKCIHCLGVYTRNMTASTIKLHLIHCRGVGQAPKVQDKKCISALKREMVASYPFDSKKKKMVAQNRYHPTIFVEKPADPILILDPRDHADESYDARKAFLTTYFNQQPYPSQREIEKLAASLWLWKSDVLSHFANQRRSCERDIGIRKPLVLLGFNMQAVNQLKHEMNFDCEWLFTVDNEKKSENSRTVKKRLNAFFDLSTDKRAHTHVKEALNHGKCKESNCAFKPSPESSETIANDFQRESEQEEMSMENRTLKTTPTFPSVIQNCTKETVLQERFLHKRGGRVASTDFTKGGSKSLDRCVSGTRTEEATWSGGISSNESLYRPAGRFEEKGKEMGLLGT